MRETWRKAAETLSEEGRLAWLLGRSLAELLSQPGAAPERGEADLVASLRELVRTAASGGLMRPAMPVLPVERVVGSTRASRTVHTGPGSATPSGPAGRPFAWPERLESRFLVVFAGAEPVHRQWVTLAVGIGPDGTKSILGLREGSTANEAVSQAVVQDLARRGLSAEQGLLFVIDGNPALDQAVRRQWGPKALVAHCQWRVRQEVLAHLPAAVRAAVGADLDRIWALPPAIAAEELRGLVNRLRVEHPGAAARLQRSGDATLAVARLGLPDPLQAHLRVTGPVRVALEEASRAGRTAGTGLAAVAAGLRRIRTRRLIGHEGLPVLARVLEEYADGVAN